MSSERAPAFVLRGLTLRVGLLLAAGLLHAGCASDDEEPVDARAETGTRLMLAGDVMLGRGLDQIQRQRVDPILYEPYVNSALGYVALAEETSGEIPREVEPSYVWGDALESVGNWAPVARIVNLETAVTTHDKPWPNKRIHYRMHPRNVAVLEAAKIDCAVLANNHALDWQRPGLAETLGALREAGMKVVGAGETLQEAASPVVLPVTGGRVLLVAAAHGSSGVPVAWAASDTRSGIHRLPDLSVKTARRLAQVIRGRRQRGDLVVVSIHWGGNWGYAVPGAERRFAHTLIDEGAADVVHGHSSHHPKGMELHGDRLILYGAGDLVNDYEGIGGHETYRPRLSLLYRPRLDAEGRLVDLVMLPFRIQRFRLQAASPEEARWLQTVLARESRGLEVAWEQGHLIGVPRRP